ncbi:MAG TPA: inositol monophosphatase family protein [Actinomycetota bacterium]
MFEEELAFAEEAADRASEIAMSFFLGTFEVREKPDRSPVTEADLAVEAAFREMVAERFPDDAVVGEEQGRTGAADRAWVVDPIDGTKNFADGVPVWATLLALQVDGRSVVGVAAAPALHERFTAVEGGGAFRNGSRIHASDRSLDRAFFLYSSVDEWIFGARRKAFEGLLRDTRRNRGFGDFWGHMLVARGVADIMVEPELNLWDWAAPEIIVREAGGRMTTFEGEPLDDVCSALTTNPLVHDEVVRRLNEDPG